MKKLVFMALALITTLNISAAKEKVVPSKIENVTVFLQGAQISRKAKFSASQGITKVIIEGVSQYFNKNSIQVKGKGDFIIMEVASKVHYPTPEPVKTDNALLKKNQSKINKMNDSIADIDWQLTVLNSDISTYQTEKNMLLTSGVMKGQTQNDSIIALKEAMDYMRIKLTEINHILLKKEKKKNGLNTLRAAIQNRLSILQNYNYNISSTQPIKNLGPVQQIVVTISADEPVSGYLYASYMVNQAGWSPAYDLRADDISTDVKLTYKANVYQSTGNDWEGVKVKLSTINPNRSNYKPTLQPWYVDYYQPIQYPQTARSVPVPQYNNNELDMEMAEEVETMSDMATIKDSKNRKYKSKKPAAVHISNYVQMSQNMAMVEFDLKLKQSIPSDGQTHLMAVKQEKISSSFEHFIVPKLDKDAFLIAHLTGWEELSLLPAVANIYYDGTYVGQTRINPNVMNDTLDLALGRDHGIYVTRKKTDDEEKIKTLSSEKIKTLTYEIAIKNYKNAEINLTIEDQIPISNKDEIKVDLLEKSEAAHDEKTGKLVWKKTIDPKETEKFEFQYELKFDKNKNLAMN